MERYFHKSYIDSEIDRIVRENNRIKVFHLTKPIVFKSWFDKLKARLKCMVLGHDWEYDGEFPAGPWYGFLPGYRCQCCGRHKLFFNKPKSRKN